MLYTGFLIFVILINYNNLNSFYFADFRKKYRRATLDHKNKVDICIIFFKMTLSSDN